MYSGYTEGPKTGAVFGFNLIFAQALAFFQWCNFALQKAEHEPEPLVINVDETSLAFHWSGVVGTILRESCAADRSKLKERRARATYICAITHDAEGRLRYEYEAFAASSLCFFPGVLGVKLELYMSLASRRRKEMVCQRLTTLRYLLQWLRGPANAFVCVSSMWLSPMGHPQKRKYVRLIASLSTANILSRQMTPDIFLPPRQFFQSAPP